MPIRSLPTTQGAPLPPTGAQTGQRRPPLAQLTAQAHYLVERAQKSGRPFDADSFNAIVARLGTESGPGIAALVGLLEQVDAGKTSKAGQRMAEHFESASQLAVIDALAAAATPCPQLLRAAYKSARAPSVRDSLCEAAAKVVGAGRALLPLMLSHLQENSFVASLSLAQHGDPAVLPRLHQRLREEVDRHRRGVSARRVGEDSSLNALHIEGLVEGIEALGGAVEPALLHALAQASARGRTGLGPLLALAQGD